MLDLIRRHSDQLACVGEIGLDYSPHVLGSEAPEEVKSLQQHVMREQVRLAKGDPLTAAAVGEASGRGT